MSTGLLRQLAARALGQASLLRPQRPGHMQFAVEGRRQVDADAQARHEGHPDGGLPSAAPPVALWPGLAEEFVQRRQAKTSQALLPVDAAESGSYTSPAPIESTALDAPDEQMTSLQRPSDEGRPTPTTTLHASTPHQGSGRRPHGQATPPAAAAADPGAAGGVEWPARLMPTQGLPRLLLSPGEARAAAAAKTPSREAAQPTEVHVSIGRVELTAVPPNAPSRTPPRRATSEPISLADYLRGGPPRGRPT